MSGQDPAPQNACGCCEGVNVQTPAVIDNRPGLSAIAYRIGTHSEFLASLQARLSSADYPVLAGLRTRDGDDFSIALLDAYACMADVLTFYQERLANESYLRTAGERRSMSELARLIGYRLRPGVAAETWLAFTMQEPPPQAESSEPKQASGVPDSITLDQAQPVKVQSLPGPDEKPQIFETVESVELRPEWNVLTPRRTKSYSTANQTEAWFDGTDLDLRIGDGLLLVDGGDSNNRQFRVISEVSVHGDTKTTQASWALELDGMPLSNLQAFVLRRRAAVFGNNAPIWNTMPTEYKDLYDPDHVGAHGQEWPAFTISPSSIDNAVDLDSPYADAMDGQWAVLVAGSSMALFKVSGVSEVTRSEFALTGKVTRLVLDADPSSFDVRDTTVYLVSEELTLVDRPDTSDVTNAVVVVSQKVDGLLPGRELILTGTTVGGDEISEVLTLMSIDTGTYQLSFAPETQRSYKRDSVKIYANVVRATHGETVNPKKQVLGSGNGQQGHQRFELKHAPLTFVGADNEIGAVSTLKVSVNDIDWHEADTLYGADAKDRSFVLRMGGGGQGTIQFGDGKQGARLPTGQDNVRATYRTGIGSAGNLKPGQLSQLLSRPLGVKAVSNPLPAEGGVDEDSVDDARRNMPLGVCTLGRVVSLLDYEDYARAFSGIAKARADVLNTKAGRTVFVTVAGAGGEKPPSLTLDNLLKAFKKRGDPFVRRQVDAYNDVRFHLGLRIACDADYDGEKVKAAVEAALRAAFCFDRRDFGQIVSRSEVITVAQEVDGVLGVDLDSFYSDPGKKDEPWLAPPAATVDGDNIVAAGILLLDDGPFDSLELIS